MTAVCVIPGCGKSVRARNWCEKHYTRWRRHGDPLIVTGDRVASPAYRTKHQRVARARGSAGQHLCAGCCSSQASQWATIHGQDGLDVFADYVPLCVRCHLQYDGQYLKCLAIGTALCLICRLEEPLAAMRRLPSGSWLCADAGGCYRRFNTDREHEEYQEGGHPDGF